MSLHAKYRMHERVLDPAMQTYDSVAEILDGVDRARISRVKKNCVGLATRSDLRRLEIYNADQAVLEEISHLSHLDVLDLGWPVVANVLRPLARLKELSILTIDSPRQVTDFSPIADLPALTHRNHAQYPPAGNSFNGTENSVHGTEGVQTRSGMRLVPRSEMGGDA